jgi:hypothetical protein
VPFELMTYDDAVRLALSERADEEARNADTTAAGRSRERDSDGRRRTGRGTVER